MTIKFESKTGKQIMQQLDFGPNTLVVVPSIGDTIETDVAQATFMRVIERRYSYVRTEVDSLDQPRTILTLILDWN